MTESPPRHSIQMTNRAKNENKKHANHIHQRVKCIWGEREWKKLGDIT